MAEHVHCFCCHRARPRQLRAYRIAFQGLGDIAVCKVCRMAVDKLVGAGTPLHRAILAVKRRKALVRARKRRGRRRRAHG